MGISIAENVIRPRLVDLASTARIVVLEAPSGAGKSTLLRHLAADHDGPAVLADLSGTRGTRDQLRSRLHRSLSLNGLSDLAAALKQGSDGDLVGVLLPWLERQAERLLILIDDLQLAEDDLAGVIAHLIDSWPAPHRLVLSGRRLPEVARQRLTGTDSVVIGPGELRFTPAEAGDLFGGDVTSLLNDTDVDRITHGCDGWAAAVSLAGVRLQRAASGSNSEVEREATELTGRPATLPDLVGSLLAAAPPPVREAVAQLSVLPALDDHLVESAGISGGVAALIDLGLPLDAAQPGRWAIPAAVRDSIAPEVRDEHLTRLAAHHYVDSALPGAALEVLEAAHLEEDLAKLLVNLPPALIGRIDPTDHAAAVAALPHRLLAAHPRILIDLADSYIVAGHSEAYAESIQRATRLIEERGSDADHDPEALEVHAADLTMRAVAHNDDRLVGEAEELLARPDLPPMARARLLGGVGRATASRRTAAALRVGARRLDEAAQAFQREGALTHAVANRVIAATFASIPLGRYDAALEQLDQALDAAPSSVTMRVAILPYRAFVLVDLGRYAEAQAVLAELRRTTNAIGTLGNERAAAFTRWAAARMASQQGDAEATWAACRAVERSDVIVDTSDGAFFRADAAQLLARVGLLDDAERLLAEARKRDPGTTDLVTTAAFVVAAHSGDLARAETVLAELDGGSRVEPRDRWRVTLLHAFACHEAGDQRTQALAAAAFEEAAQLGYPDLPLIHEPRIAHLLLPFAERSSASARDATPRTHLNVLGGFTIEVGHEVIEPSGRPGELVAFLALNDRLSTVDQAIEALWPDTEPARGRERLRTVLRRTRRDLGDLIERHDDLLRLRSSVTVDAEEFLSFCRQADDPAANRERSAAAALELYRGEAVPSLGYREWAEPARRQLELQALAMHDAVADETAGDGRIDDAIRSLLAALERDPIAEDRYLAAARLLAEQGRRSRALQLLAEGRGALQRAGIAPSTELSRLEAYLQRSPAMSAAEAC